MEALQLVVVGVVVVVVVAVVHNIDIGVCVPKMGVSVPFSRSQPLSHPFRVSIVLKMCIKYPKVTVNPFKKLRIRILGIEKMYINIKKC